MPQPESIIRDQIFAYLITLGYFVWKDFQTHGKPGRNYSRSKTGTPDIIGATPDGQFIGIEVKQPGGKVGVDQTEWMRRARKSNCFVFVATSIEDVQTMLKLWEKGRVELCKWSEIQA